MSQFLLAQAFYQRYLTYLSLLSLLNFIFLYLTQQL